MVAHNQMVELALLQGPCMGTAKYLASGQKRQRKFLETWSAGSGFQLNFLAFLGFELVDRRTCALMDRDEGLQGSRQEAKSRVV